MTNNPLVEALREARNAIASLPEFALGGVVLTDTHTGEPTGQYGVRDELLAKIDTALASSAPATGDDKGLVESIGYLLATVDAHADKFPVPSHMRNHVQFIRQRLAALSSAPATGEREQIVGWRDRGASSDEDINRHIFDWFNERDPEDMAQCLADFDHRTQSGEMEGGEHE